MTKDVIRTIINQMMLDDENDSERLCHLYENADPDQQALIDDVLICLCGYSMDSLLNMSDDMDDEEEDEDGEDGILFD